MLFRSALVGAGIVAAVAILAVVAIALALQWAHFVGATPDGRLAVYRGIPVALTSDLVLYHAVEITDVPVALLPADQRRTLLDQRIGSRASAEARIAPLLASPWLRQPAAQ